MSFLKKLKTADKVEAPTDRLGGSNVRKSDVNTFVFKNMYFLPSDKGAMMCYVTLTDESGQDYREALCVASGDAKDNSPTYVNNGKTYFLPGYNIVNAMTMLVLETDITDIETETNVVKHYDKGAKKEVPTEVEVVVDIIGQSVQLAIKHAAKNKQEQVNGKWVDINEKREFNEIDSVFHEGTDQTLSEALEELEATHKEAWLTKNKDKVFDTFKEVSGGVKNGGNSLTSQKGNAASGTKKSTMFAKK